MLLPEEVSVQIPVGSRSLDGALWKRPRGSGAGGVLLLHPHPQMGGDMNNHVVTYSAKAMHNEKAGGVRATLRFNLRFRERVTKK